MLKMTIDNEEVVSKNNFTIKEEMLSPSSTILNNTYPKTWEDDKDYTSRFYYPKDYAKLNIQNFSITPEEAGTTIQVNGSATLTDVDTTKESRVLSLKGQTSQTGTPTPSSPIPVNVVSGDNYINIEGKNILNLNNFTTTTQSGITLTPNFENGKLVSISTSGTYSSTTYILLTNTQKIQPNKQYTLSGAFNASARLRLREYDSSNTQLSEYFDSGYGVTFTSKNNVDHINVQVVFYASNPSAIFYPMIEVGSTSTTYEPYIGNTYPIYLGVENLFNKETAILNVGINTSNGNTYNDTNLFSSDYIPITINTPYVANSASTTGNRVFGACYDSNKGYLGAVSTGVGERTFTVTNTNAKYVRITGQKVNIDTYQIEEGTKIHSYSPYGQTPIELCKIGTYQDYIYKDNGSWYLHKEIGKVVLDGSETYSYSAGNKNTLLLDIGMIATNIETTGYVKCNYYEEKGNASADSVDYAISRYGATTTYNYQKLVFKNKDMTSANDFKTWLSTHNTIVYYVLANSTTTEITDTTLISQLDALESQ